MIVQDGRLTPPVTLTPREVEVMLWTARGKTYNEISTVLGISENTVKSHIENVRNKLNATNKTHMIAVAIQLGLVRP